MRDTDRGCHSECIVKFRIKWLKKAVKSQNSCQLHVFAL